MNPLPQTAPRRALLAALVGLALAGPAAAGGPSRPEGLCTAPRQANVFSRPLAVSTRTPALRCLPSV